MIGTGRKIEVPRAGAMVPAFQLLDTVSKGVLGGGHGVLVYHCRKNTCARTGKRRPRFRCRTGCGNFSSPIRKTFFSAPHRVISPSRGAAIQTEKGRLSYWVLLTNFAAALVPFILVAGALGVVRGCVVIHDALAAEPPLRRLNRMC
jgi:hypothetical protein